MPSPSVDRFKQNATKELVITNATTPILPNTDKPKEWTKTDIADALGGISTSLAVVNAICFFVFPAACPYISLASLICDGTAGVLYAYEGKEEAFAISFTGVVADALGVAGLYKPFARNIPSILRVGYNPGARRYIQGNGRFIKTVTGKKIYFFEDIAVPGTLWGLGKIEWEKE
ncbi:MAG: hypothetical protein MJ196_05705 [Treponemataceae bacterium]|nr:hypothetical protein [Treponemataceae bacterium]